MPSNQNSEPARAPRESATLATEVDAPIWRVYQSWRRLDRFPSFVSFVRVAKWRNTERLFWCEEHDGQLYEWTYAVTTDPSQNSVSWITLSGPENSGSVKCEPLPDGRSRLTMTIHFVPDQQLQAVAAVHRRHSAFLRGFKQSLEQNTH